MSDTPEMQQVPESQPAISADKPAEPKQFIPIIALVIQTSSTLVAYNLGSTNYHMLIGLILVPAICILAVAVWWFTVRSVSLVDRLSIMATAGIAVAVFAVIHGGIGFPLVILAIPILVSLLVVAMLCSQGIEWKIRKRLGMAIILGWLISGSLIRVDSIGGDLIPVLAWRWAPPMETQYAVDETQTTTLAKEPITLPETPGENDWAEFRGPSRDGRAVSQTFATNWDENPPTELWRKDIGLGWSSFTVIGGYVFTQEQRGDGEFVVCYEAETGEQIWANHVDARFSESMGDGPRATPTYFDGKLFSQGATGILQCINASAGETLWSRDVRGDTGAKIPQWGFASSPLIARGNVIVFTGGGDGNSVIAYNADSGEVSWTSGNGSTGYCSAQLSTLSGVEQILLTSNYGMESFDPETGDLLWEHVWAGTTFERVVQPLLLGDNTVIFGDGAVKGSRKLSVFKDGDDWNVTETWSSRRLKPYFNDVVLHEGYIYGYEGNRLVCVNAETGEAAWRGDRVGGQVLLLPEMDVVLCLTEEGVVQLVEAKPDELRVLATMNALEGKTWNHPVVANGKLFVRNSQEAVCYELPQT